MNNVGLLCVKDEADVLVESLPHHAARFEQIVAINGSTDAGAWLVAMCPNVIRIFADADVIPAGGRFCDACRQPALTWIMREFGPDTWVTLLHADEFWEDEPILATEAADADGATFILWGEFRFFLHSSDRGQPTTGPIRERLLWHCGPFYEVRAFRLREHQLYVPGRDHQTLPVGLPGMRWAVCPRYRHYPYRSPEQCRRAYMDKVLARYWQPDHAWLGLGDCYVDSLPKPLNSPLAHWDRVRRYDGDLPDPAAMLPAWWEGTTRCIGALRHPATLVM